MTQPPVGAELSPREKQIISLVSQGLTNREVGGVMFLSHLTVKSHLRRIFHKTGATSRAHLVLLCGRSLVPSEVADLLRDLRNRTAAPVHPLGTADWYRQEGALRAMDTMIAQLVTAPKAQEPKQARKPWFDLPHPGGSL